MVKTGCVNPEILAVLSKCGHGDQVLIGSGNFPLESQIFSDAKKIYLGITPGVPTSTEILKSLLSVINVEEAGVIAPPDGNISGEIFEEYKKILNCEDLKGYTREEYYQACQKSSVKVGIESADQRAFSNILLTIGVVRAE